MLTFSDYPWEVGKTVEEYASPSLTCLMNAWILRI